VVVERPVETWITCRMTHTAALEVLRGGAAAQACRPLLDVGYAALTGRLRDAEHGGWLPAVGGTSPQPTEKVAYAHAFVVLAGASLTAAGHPGGRDLLDEALEVFDAHFWDESAGMAREQFDRAWTRCEDYRGVNANMHTVEAMLAAGEVLGDSRFTDRALRIIRRVVGGFATANSWRLPEHFDADWNVRWDYNRDRPADQFRPYGVTIGHVLEWSRLALNTRHTLGDRAGEPEWDFLVTDAAAMFEAGVSRGWGVDGADGLVYTTDFADRPIVRERLHWVVCEGIAAAWALFEDTDRAEFHDWYDRLWAYAERHLLDDEHGGWIHELAPDNTPGSSIWWGKPDLYHAYQCALVPLLPGMVSFAGACAHAR
jgi:mannose/cellobiose epimerase-like protein (N-acyl-D-glucosamine 2-epimerase family)